VFRAAIQRRWEGKDPHAVAGEQKDLAIVAAIEYEAVLEQIVSQRRQT
jgi:hypothetical protein